MTNTYEDEEVRTSMARTTSRVNGDRLVLASNDESSIMVGTPAWFAWLEGMTTFAFSGSSVRFTARKEARSLGEGVTTTKPSTIGAQRPLASN